MNVAARAAFALGLAVGASAHAQSLVDVVPEDPCAQAMALDQDDVSPAAEHLRRACRLRRLDQKLTAERQQEIVAAEQAREGKIQRWIDQTQPPRVTRPFSFDGMVGAGVATYGLSFAWAFLKKAELAVWLGKRSISCDAVNARNGADCSRTSYGFHGRWYLLSSKLSPFLGIGLTISNAHLQLVQGAMYGVGGTLLSGQGRANSYNAGAGVQLAYAAFRLSAEYVYEHAYYTGSSLDDRMKTPNGTLNEVWSNSLKDDRHGFRVQAGYAF